MPLSWRAQNIVVIGWVYLKLERSAFSSNFEFDRNMLSGTGAWTDVASLWIRSLRTYIHEVWQKTDNIFKCIFLNENVWISIKISLKFVLKGPINNTHFAKYVEMEDMDEWVFARFGPCRMNFGGMPHPKKVNNFTLVINSFTPEITASKYKFFKDIKIAQNFFLRWMSQDLIDEMSTLVQVNGLWQHETSH